MMESFAKIVNGCNSLTCFAQKLYRNFLVAPELPLGSNKVFRNS